MAGNGARSDSFRVSVFDDVVKGKGLKAESDADIGVTILSEVPVSFVVTRKQRETTCAGCLGLSSNDNRLANDTQGLRKCSKCKFVYYCGISCQKKDWLNHKQECKNIVRVLPKIPPDLCLLAARFLDYVTRSSRKAMVESGESNTLLCDQRLQYAKDFFMKKMEQIFEKRKEMLFTFSVVLKQFVDTKTLEVLGLLANDLIGIICWLTCNCFNILNSDMNSVGIGIYDMACLINHSCVPNCVAVFEQENVLIRTIRPISRNDEILISYIESLETKEERAQELRERYFFECICHMCSTDRPILGRCQNKNCSSPVFVGQDNSVCQKCEFSYSKQMCSELGQEHNILKSKLDDYNANETEENFDALCEVVKKAAEYVPNECIDMIKCLEVIFDRNIKIQNWSLAIESGVSLLHGYQSCYPTYHPVVGVHLFKLGKIEILTENLERGLEHLESSSKILLVSHGKEHGLTTTLLETIGSVKEEMILMRPQKALRALRVKKS